MRFFPLLIIIVLFLQACNNKKQPAGEKNNSSSEIKADSASVKSMELFLGSFVGPFGDNKITLLITKIKGDSIEGRTIVGGNDRPFYGTFAKKGYTYYFHGKEPGDHKDDGVFDFEIDESHPENLNGVWNPNDKKRPAKTYALLRKKFEYNPTVGDYPQASQRLLKPSDVENEMKEDLEFMRNEIFARHGFCFNKKHLRQQFELQDWYVPNTVDIKGFLTDIEKKNIELIKRYEKYADEYGDEYGR